MAVWNLSIRRPIVVVMATAMLILSGLIALNKLPVREMPKMDFPVVMIDIAYPGAAPEIVDLDVVEPLEDELGSIAGIRRLESVSVDGAARIDVEFELERDIDDAMREVRDRMARARSKMPRTIEEPVVYKLDLNAQPIMWLALTSEHHSIGELTEYWDRNLKNQLQRVRGVGHFLLAGAKKYALRVWIDADELATRRLTASDIIEALRQHNVTLPAGRIEGKTREFTIKLDAQAKSIAEMERIVVSAEGDEVVYLGDVARVVPGAEDERGAARFSVLPDTIGGEALGIGILKQAEGNAIQVASRIRTRLAQISDQLPEGMSVRVALDASVYVQQSIDELEEAVLLGLLLTALVVLLFLGSGRATIIVVIVVPTALLTSFMALYLMGFSINTFTMLALVLVVGVVIDDAILVLESIYRDLGEGATPIEAADRGTSRVAFAAIATTLVLIVVFAPLALVEGMVGRLLAEFALTIAVSVGISTAVALTLIPLLCSRFLSGSASRSRLAVRADRIAESMANGYGRLLAAALRQRWVVVMGAVGSLVGTGALVMTVPSEMTPPVDEGAFVAFLIAPEGSTPEYTDGQLRRVEEMLAELPEVESFLAITSPSFGGIVPKSNEAVGLVKLRPLLHRREQGMRSQAEVMAEVRSRLRDLPGAQTSVFARPGLLSGSSGAPIQILVFASDVETLYDGTQRLREGIAEVQGIVDPSSSLRLDKPQLRATPKAETMVGLGITPSTLAETMQTLLGGSHVANFVRDGRTYDIVAQLEKEDREIPEAAEMLAVRSASGELVPLSSVIDIEEGVHLNEVRRYDRARVAYIEAHLDRLPLGEALAQVEKVSGTVLPANVESRPVGAALSMDESFASLGFVFLLAIIATYMLLASQFNSFFQPFAIMAAIPLGLFGAIFALWAWGLTLNLFSIIGMLMLIGLVVKNSILLIDYTNQRRAAGDSPEEALVAAGKVRLRPILMTAASTIFAVLPAIVGLGAGTETRQPLAVAVFGGMLMATILTLLVVPVLYSLFDGGASNTRRFLRWATGWTTPGGGADAEKAQEEEGDGDFRKDFTRGSVLVHVLAMAGLTGVYQLLEVLYFLADLYWIQSYGTEAIAAVTIAGHLQLISMGLGMTLMVGITPIVAQATGQDEESGLRLMFNQHLLLSFAMTLGFALVVFSVLPFYFGWFGASSETESLGITYAVWLIPGLALKLGAMALVGPLRAFGDMTSAVAANGSAMLLNMVLDPLLILGVGPFPELGIAGAGIASFISGCLAVALMFWRYDLERRKLPHQESAWKPRLAMWGKTLNIGLPVGANPVIDMMWTVILYWAIRDFGTAAQAAAGIAEKIRAGVLLPVLAIAFSIAPIVGQNLGKGLFHRVRTTYRSTSLTAGSLMLVFSVIIFIWPEWLVKPFTDDPDTIAMAATYLAVVAVVHPGMAVLNVCLGVFEGLGNTRPPIITDAMRLGVFAALVVLFSGRTGFEFVHVPLMALAAYAVQLVVLPLLLGRELAAHSEA